MRSIGIFVVCTAAWVSAGCAGLGPDRPAAVQVAVEGGGEFPAGLAGRWVADREGWEFTLEPDGRISSAVISLGRVRVTPGRTAKVPTRSGQEAIFTPGLWTVYYRADTGELTVNITMDHVRVDMAGDTLEGSSRDVFTGPVSPAGDTWQTEWTTFTHYTAHTPQGTSFDLSTDPTYGETKPLTFHKAPPRPR